MGLQLELPTPLVAAVNSGIGLAATKLAVVGYSEVCDCCSGVCEDD